MTPEQAAHETASAIVSTSSRFMTDPATYGDAAKLGFEGMDFYIAGRGGVLGEVPAAVATAALVFFEPAAVSAAWVRSGSLMSRAEAAATWADAMHHWARAHFADDVDWARVAELAGEIVRAAPVAGAPLFAGWRVLPEPGDAKALAMHRMNALRELRGALHEAAILTVGLTPLEAIAVRSPRMASVFGWTEALPDTAPLLDRWQLAESRTDRMIGRHYRALTESAREEFVTLLSNS
ncbi:MAG TPA: hypothetical protein VFX21_04585 [Acidimicrobiia bacterium]|nr:hypothetical protein [Acidimicrobiia bacterium]